MRVDVRRYASLDAPSRAGLPGEPEEIVLRDGGTVADLIAALHHLPDDVALVIVNGRIVHDRSVPLSDGDRVALFPPVGGG